MPRSKRNKIVSLTQTQKKPGRENNERLVTAIREAIDLYPHIVLFTVENERNTYLKELRAGLSDSRLFFGKTKVAAVALGTTVESAYEPGLNELAAHMHGAVGLCLSPRPVPELLSHLRSFSKSSFARMNAIAPLDFVVPGGIVYSFGGQIAAEDDLPLAHSLEVTVRGLGMPTKLVKGKVWLDQEFVVCREGEKLSAQKAGLLKVFGYAAAEFRCRPKAWWGKEDGKVEVVEDKEEAEEVTEA